MISDVNILDGEPYRDMLRQVLDTEYRKKKMMAGRHIAISTWLDALHMQEYQHMFQAYGGVEDLLYSTEAEIKELGIQNPTHRGKIVSSLRALRDRYEKGRVTGSGVFSIQRSPSNSIPNSPTGAYPAEFDHVIASPEKLQLDLQKELSGDPSELRSRPWYHGTISRQRAECLVSTANGNFLVRDCISSPGDFVLTCCWNGTPLNFMINAIVGNCAPGQLPPLSYKFEEEAFSSIQQLVAFYQSRGKPVTVVSGALLKNAVARCMPLSYYDTKYGASVSFASAAASGLYGGTPVGSPKPSPFVTPEGSPQESSDMNKRGVFWTGSQPILSLSGDEPGPTSDNRKSSLTSRNVQYEDGSTAPGRSSKAPPLDRCDSLPVISITPPVVGKSSQRPDYTASFGSSRGSNSTNRANADPKIESERLYDNSSRLPKQVTSHMRAGSAPALVPSEELERVRQLQNGSPSNSEAKSTPGEEPPPLLNDKRSSLARLGLGRTSPFGGRLVSASSEGELTNPPPPKPSRIPSVKYKQKPRVVIRRPAEVEDDDRDYSDYFQVKEEPSWIHGDTETAPKFREDPPKRLAPSPLAKIDSQHNKPALPQMGRRANRLAQEEKNFPSYSFKPTVPISQQQRPQLSSPSMTTPVMRNPHHEKHPPESHNSHRDGLFVTSPMMRVPPLHPYNNVNETPPMTPTYQIVARSRSFQSAQQQGYFNFDTNIDSIKSNNINNVKNKGYKTLPNRSSRSKLTRTRRTSDHTQILGDGETTNDYDVPREHADEETTQVFNFQNNNNNINDANVLGQRVLAQPPKYFATGILPESFTSNLLPKGHKALDQTALLKVKKLLLSKSARQLALTLTYYDLQLLKVTGTTDLGMGVYSGLELLTLPQGKQLRQDGLERWECLRLFVMMTLLACPTVSERAGLLSLWIQTCLELKGGASDGQESRGGAGSGSGNLFSFAAVMSGLCGEPIWRLTDTWLILRQMHTPSAFKFDTRLRPALSALNDATADLPVNRVSVPYVTPVCRLLEQSGPGVASVFTNSMKNNLTRDPIKGTTLITPPPKSLSMSPHNQRQSAMLNSNNNNINNNNNNSYEYYWEAGLDPVGGAVDVLLAHLDTARVIAAQGPLYFTTGHALMTSFEPDLDLSAVLSTEFHMLLLWGEKGWSVNRSERVGKLQQILTVLSNRYQVPGDDGTEV